MPGTARASLSATCHRWGAGFCKREGLRARLRRLRIAGACTRLERSVLCLPLPSLPWQRQQWSLATSLADRHGVLVPEPGTGRLHPSF